MLYTGTVHLNQQHSYAMEGTPKVLNWNAVDGCEVKARNKNAKNIYNFK